MTCRICNGPTSGIFQRKVLRQYDVQYSRCNSCGFVCTEDPFWLEEAYKRPINVCDTGILSRNEHLRDALALLFYIQYDNHCHFLDYAGGYGLLTRMMRDSGYDFVWHDPYTENLFAKGFEHHDKHVPYSAITCCECFEHFVDPVKELRKILGYGRNVYFTTTLIPGDPPAPEEWDYYGFNHGQHVSFYTIDSLRHLADAFGLGFVTNRKQFHFIGESPPNQALLRIAYSPIARLLPSFLRKLKGSLKESDHQQMIGLG